MSERILSSPASPAIFPERWGFLRAPFGILVDAVTSWNKSLYSDVRTMPLQDDVVRMMEMVKDRTVPMKKFLIATTRSEWNACFSNSLGGDVTSLIGYMSEVLDCEGLEITLVPPLSQPIPGEVHYPACQFSLYSGKVIDHSNLKRSIVCMNDGGRWIFEAIGQMQDFEEPGRYASKKVRDRFTPDMLERYCQALGIDPFRESFYGNTGVLFDFSEPR